MIRLILQDSSTIPPTEKWHSTHLSLSEVEDIILNSDSEKGLKYIIRPLIEQNRTTFNVTGKTYDKLIEYVREFQDELNWSAICIHQKLSEYFIREFQDKVDWFWICRHQKLSEDFIRDFQDKVNWIQVSICQNLSEEFIREFQDKVDCKEFS